MIDRIETCVRAVDRIEERQEMHAAEKTVQRPREQRIKLDEPAAGQPIHVSDQLDLVMHGSRLRVRAASL